MFGSSFDYQGAITELIKKTDSVSGFDAEIIRREFYEELSGIVRLDDPQRPLALVGESPIDGNRLLWPMYNRIREFKMYEVYKHYGLSLTEFLDLPRDIVEMILNELRDDAERQRVARRRAEQKLDSGAIPVDVSDKGL
jgi:hypothetical protein